MALLPRRYQTNPRAVKEDIADLRAAVDALDHAFQKEWIRVDWQKGARDS
jgi:hypothetical protein